MYRYLILATVIYFLLFWVRTIQGGWEPKTEFFKPTRHLLDEKISRLLPSPQAEILSGILLGENKTLPGSMKLALRDTSTLHIVVASGQNLSMIGGFFLALSGLIKRRNAILLSLLVVTIYTLLTGAQVPILRAAVMFSLASLAALLGRERSAVWILFITAGLMLLINPSWISSISFQLSFLATFGVVVVAPIFTRFFQKLPLIGQDLSVSLAAQLMVAPVIAQNFHQFSFVGLITNVLILWTIPIIMIGGAVMLVASFIWMGFGAFVALGLNALLTYFIYIVQFFSSLPFAWEYVGEKIWVVWVGYYLLISGMLLLINGTKTDSRRP